MRVAKWGNSLAIRLPAKVVKELGLIEGDEVELKATCARTLEISRDAEREWAIQTMRRLRRPLPKDYKFDRDDIHERGGRDDGE